MNSLIEKIWREEYKPSEKQVLYGEEIMHATRLLDAKERELWERLSDENRIHPRCAFCGNDVKGIY